MSQLGTAVAAIASVIAIVAGPQRAVAAPPRGYRCGPDGAPVQGEGCRCGPGKVAAIWARSGKVSWSMNLPSRSESSPIIVDHRVYFGTEDGTVYGMRVDDGSIQWKFRAAGAASVALGITSR